MTNLTITDLQVCQCSCYSSSFLSYGKTVCLSKWHSNSYRSLHFTSRALSRGGVGGPDPSTPKVSVVCIFWHHPQFPHVPVHKIAPSPSGSASWSPSGDLHVHHLSEFAFLFPTVHMPKPSEPALPCFAFYTPYPQLFSDIFK